MTDHTCVRNPDTGSCYVCRTAMRKNFGVMTPLESAIDATEHPQAKPTAPAHTCHCGEIIKASETECIDCFIAGQVAARPMPKPKPPATNPVSLDSIIDAMETNPNKWN